MGTKFKVQDDNYQAKVRDSFSRQAFMKTLGAELTRVEPGLCEITMRYLESLTQQHHFLHAGAVAAIADSAAG